MSKRDNIIIKVDNVTFNRIKKHKQKMILQLYKDDIQNVDIKDTIILVSNNKMMKRKVKQIYKYINIDDLCKSVNKKKLGINSGADLSYDDIAKCFPKDDISKYEIISIEIDQQGTFRLSSPRPTDIVVLGVFIAFIAFLAWLSGAFSFLSSTPNISGTYISNDTGCTLRVGKLTKLECPMEIIPGEELSFIRYIMTKNFRGYDIRFYDRFDNGMSCDIDKDDNYKSIRCYNYNLFGNEYIKFYKEKK